MIRNSYLLVVVSFFGLSEIKRHILLYLQILASPTKGTIELFAAGRLIDSVRFLGYGTALYMVALSTYGFALFDKNDFVNSIAVLVLAAISWSVTYALY